MFVVDGHVIQEQIRVGVQLRVHAAQEHVRGRIAGPGADLLQQVHGLALHQNHLNLIFFFEQRDGGVQQFVAAGRVDGQHVAAGPGRDGVAVRIEKSRGLEQRDDCGRGKQKPFAHGAPGGVICHDIPPCVIRKRKMYPVRSGTAEPVFFSNFDYSTIIALAGEILQ